MLLDDDGLGEIEDLLVSAALRPEAWPSAVAQIVHRSGAHGAVVLPVYGRVPGIPLSQSCEGLIETYFAAGWAQRDHRASGVPKLFQTGLFVDQDVCTPDFMRTSPYYTDFLGSFGLQWFAGLLIAVGGDAWCLTLQRTREQGLFTPDEQMALRRMIAPLKRAARFMQTIGEARFRGIVDTLDALRVAGLLLDRTGRAIHVNERAAELLGRDFDLTRGQLSVPADRRASAAIRAHIEAAIWKDLRPDDRALHPVMIERVGRPPLILSAQPLRKAGLEYLEGARAIITIKDLAETKPLATNSLRKFYGLTSREVEICEALLLGSGLTECADKLQITFETARTHLKRIMAKTATTRQSGLLMLLNQHRQS